MTGYAQTRLTAVGSGKGGTGKTFVSVGLAQALSLEGERVLLFDADLGLANTAVQLGLGDSGDIEAVLLNGHIAVDWVKPVGGGIPVRGGFDLLAPPAGSGAFADIDVRTAERLVAMLRATRRYDRVVLDLAAGVDSVTMTFAASADEALLVLTPDPSALTDAYAFVKLTLRGGGRLPSTIANMAENTGVAGRVGDSLTHTCRAFLKQAPESAGRIPRDMRVVQAMRRQAPLLSLYPEAPAARAITAIARWLRRQSEPLLARSAGVR